MPIPTEKTPKKETAGIEIRSPNRPLPRSAKEKLNNISEIKAELSPPDGYNHRMDGVIVADMPPKELLDEFELSIVCDPDIIYESDRGEEVLIYTDLNTVIMDGMEKDDDPRRIIEMAENADHMTLQKGNPDGVTNN